MHKSYSVHALYCLEHTETRTAVLSIAALLTVGLPVHSCSSQTVSTYGVSKTVTVSAVTVVTVLPFVYVLPSVGSSY
jgi:hypothetical protein